MLLIHLQPRFVVASLPLPFFGTGTLEKRSDLCWPCEEAPWKMVHVMSSSEHIQQFGDKILTAEVGKRTTHG